MIHGGICRYPGGSQLAAAAAFLRAHRGHVLLVTIDIGANDPEVCGSQLELGLLASCVGQVAGAAASAVHDPGQPARGGRAGRTHRGDELLPARTRRVAQRHDRPCGRVASERLAVAYNDQLDQAYAQAGVGVADVFGPSTPPTSAIP